MKPHGIATVCSLNHIGPFMSTLGFIYWSKTLQVNRKCQHSKICRMWKEKIDLGVSKVLAEGLNWQLKSQHSLASRVTFFMKYTCSVCSCWLVLKKTVWIILSKNIILTSFTELILAFFVCVFGSVFKVHLDKSAAYLIRWCFTHNISADVSHFYLSSLSPACLLICSYLSCCLGCSTARRQRLAAGRRM